MAQKMGHLITENPIKIGDLDIESLRAWYKQYKADDAPEPKSISLDNNELDQAEIEKEVQSLVLTTNVKEGFCPACTSLIDSWPTPPLEPFVPCFGKSCPTIELEAGARAGCRLCGLLFSTLQTMGIVDFFRIIERRLSILNNHSKPSLTIAAISTDMQQLWLEYPEKFSEHLAMDPSMVIFESSIQSLNGNYVQPPYNENNIHSSLVLKHGEIVKMPTTEQVVDWVENAKAWIFECDNSHKQCQITRVRDRPSRLVSVSENSLKLVQTTAWETMPRYATLSYCWGKATSINLKKDNLDFLLTSIPADGLPKTIRDAIQVARTLNIPYIWIDALCIMQDDLDDWLQEAAKMHSVYGGSYLNMAAASAIDANQGLHHKLPYYNGGFSTKTRAATSKAHDLRNFYSINVATEVLQDIHLATRAWTLQERLLPTRTLYFGDTGLSWECVCAFRSEFLPQGIPNLEYSRLLRHRDQPWEWLDIVQNFSKAQLTNGHDRLPALSGIASRQHEVTGAKSKYLAGLWSDSLYEQLTWNLRDNKSALKPRPPWRAPTWSWASVDGEASWRPIGVPGKVVYHVKIRDAWTTISGHDQFGLVSAGQLTIACSAIIRGALETSTDDWCKRLSPGHEHAFLDNAPYPFHIDFDCLEDASTQSDKTVYFVPIYSGPTGAQIDKGSFAIGGESQSRYVASEADDGPGGWIDQFAVHGLVLRSTGDKKGCFSRIGFFTYNNAGRGRDTEYPSMMRLLKGCDTAVAETVCERVDRSGDDANMLFIITIV